MPYYCPPCNNKVKTVDSICCDNCEKYYHLECSGLTNAQFDIYVADKDFTWYCKDCIEDCCRKCDIIIRRGGKIKCDLCAKSYHLRCAGHSKTSLIPNETWYCYQCNDDIFPFSSQNIKIIQNLSFNSIHTKNYPNKLKSLHESLVRNPQTQPKYIERCNVCCKKNSNAKTSIPCPSCKHLTHKKCSNLKSQDLAQLKNTPNAWECATCLADKFPFEPCDDADLYAETFNSNFTCSSCKTKVIKIDNSELKLRLNAKEIVKDNFNPAGEEFDNQYNSQYALDPDFNYYETHEFHTLKAKLKDPFSIIHTNICSLQHNGDHFINLLACFYKTLVLMVFNFSEGAWT